MQDNLNFTVKDNFLAELQLEKLQKLLAQFGVDVIYKKSGADYNVDLMWDTSNVYKKSTRYAGRNKIHTNLDWDQVSMLKSMGMTNDEISDHLGVNIRTYYRRKSEHKKGENS